MRSCSTKPKYKSALVATMDACFAMHTSWFAKSVSLGEELCKLHCKGVWSVGGVCTAPCARADGMKIT